MNTHIIAALPLGYTLTGESKNATSSLGSDEEMTFTATSRDKKHCRRNVIRARLISNFGLVPPQGELAAELEIGVFGSDGTQKGTFTLSFVEWDKWEPKESFTFDDDSTFKLLANSKIHIYDSNVQDAYIGDDVEPLLELEVYDVSE